MTKEEITEDVIMVISANSKFTEEGVWRLYRLAFPEGHYDPKADPKLERFIPATKKQRLANMLKREMRCVDPTELNNQLYSSITTLVQLILKVRDYCETSTV